MGYFFRAFLPIGKEVLLFVYIDTMQQGEVMRIGAK
jgi:hypothetical protein